MFVSYSIVYLLVLPCKNGIFYTCSRIVTAGTISNSIPGGSEESEVKIDDHSNNKNKTLHGNDDNLWNYSPEVSDTTVYNNAVINSSTSGNITNEELLSSHTKAGYLYQLLYAGYVHHIKDSTFVRICYI